MFSHVGDYGIVTMEFSNLSHPAPTAETTKPGFFGISTSQRAHKISIPTSLEFSVHTESEDRVFSTVNGPAGKPYRYGTSTESLV